MGGFTLNPPKKGALRARARYNKVLRIYLFGTRIYNADINRPYKSGLSSPNSSRQRKWNQRVRGQFIRTTNFVRAKARLFDEWKYVIVQVLRLWMRFIVIV